MTDQTLEPRSRIVGDLMVAEFRERQDHNYLVDLVRRMHDQFRKDVWLQVKGERGDWSGFICAIEEAADEIPAREE